MLERNADTDTLGGIGPNSTQQSEDKGTETAIVLAPTETVPAETEYVLNTNTHKFHYPVCSSVKQMNEENKWFYSGTRDEVISMGYSSCGRCRP